MTDGPVYFDGTKWRSVGLSEARGLAASGVQTAGSFEAVFFDDPDTLSETRRSHRRLDVASLVLLLVGLVFGGLSYWLITNQAENPLTIVPSVVAATIGATHLFQRQAPRL